MHDMTASHLRSAYGGESMAHLRYRAWATKAEADGFVNIARLFRAISHAETIHAGNHFTELKDEDGALLVASMAGFGIGTTSGNLAGAIEGELFEVNEMYAAYLEVAKAQQEKGALLSFHYAISAEKTHAELYQQAKDAVDAGSDLALGAVQVCEKCGYTVEGDAPGKCPICAETADKFVSFS